ncbi:hypothetical protein DDI_3332 [Dickeya dianthicola RNS04.9]|nr:hypothetical protein DDI_3332 [Dickeya dianthicola RNS04.9]
MRRYADFGKRRQTEITFLKVLIFSHFLIAVNGGASYK